MHFGDYRDKFHTICLERREGRMLEIALQTRVGPALWGTSMRSLHTGLGFGLGPEALAMPTL